MPVLMKNYPKCCATMMKQDRIFWGVAVLALTLYNLTPSIEGFDIAYYISAGDNLLRGRLDCLRTPTYPLILGLLKSLIGTRGMAIAVTILQSLAYLISVRCLLYLIRKTVKNNIVRWTTAYYYVLVLAPALCNELATESLSISGCMIFVDLLFR